MHSILDADKEYLEHKFVDSSFYDNSPGLALPELKEKLKECFVRDRELPHTLAKAAAFREVMEHVRIRISEHDWFVGIAVYPEKPLRAIYTDSWLKEGFSSTFSAEERNEINLFNGTCLAQLRVDYEHSVPDWDAVLKLGFSGLLKRAEKYEQRHLASKVLTSEKQNYFEAVRIVYRSILHLMDRLCSEAEKISGSPRGAKIFSALCQLRSGAATDIYEALLQIWLYFQLSEFVDVIQTRSFGNLDRVLCPYYRRDIDSGRYTEKDIRGFFNSFMYQSTAMHYAVGHPFYFGGTNSDGTSAINELSYLILDEYDKMGIYDPKLQIKVSENTPVDFIDKALDMIRRGHNSIAFVGEPCIIRAMQKHGYSQAEARTADIKGCYEYCVRGETVETAPVTVNTAKIIGLVLHNGIEPISGKKLGLETGNPEKFTSFEQLYNAFMKQIFYIYDRIIGYSERLENQLDQFNPAPMLSGTFQSSLKQAEDGYARGALYNNSNLWICGPVTAADSLAMIKRWVFDQKLLTLSDLITMLDCNWQGYESWRTKLLYDPNKFGNNLDEPDAIAKNFTEAVAHRYHGKPNSRGGFYTVSLHSSNRFFEWADKVEATPDGRRRGDELNKNISATQGAAGKGATALIASVLKLDSSLFMADFPVDVMLHPSEINGNSGLCTMRSLLMTYIKNFGHAIHFNVMDPKILCEAQREPAKFRDLQVRICGWNVLWNSMAKKEQDAYILQAKQRSR